MSFLQITLLCRKCSQSSRSEEDLGLINWTSVHFSKCFTSDCKQREIVICFFSIFTCRHQWRLLLAFMLSSMFLSNVNYHASSHVLTPDSNISTPFLLFAHTPCGAKGAILFCTICINTVAVVFFILISYDETNLIICS